MRGLRIHANVAVIAGEGERGQPVGRGRLALLLGRLGLLHHRGQIFAVGVGLANGLVHIDLVEGRIRRLVGQREALRQRQPDGPRQGQLVLFQSIPRHNQLLLQRLIIHAGAQLIQQRRGAGLMVGNRLVERNLRRGHLRFHAGHAGLIGQRQQVGIAHHQHHQFARILSRQLSGGKVVPRGQVVAQRGHIDQRPSQDWPADR